MKSRTALLVAATIVAGSWGVAGASGSEPPAGASGSEPAKGAPGSEPTAGAYASETPYEAVTVDSVLDPQNCDSGLISFASPLWHSETVGSDSGEDAVAYFLDIVAPTLPDGRLVADEDDEASIAWVVRGDVYATFTVFELPKGGWGVDSAFWCHD